MDIPRVDDIPIVSQLAKKSQKELLAEMDVVEQKQHKIQTNKENIKKVMQDDE